MFDPDWNPIDSSLSSQTQFYMSLIFAHKTNTNSIHSKIPKSKHPFPPPFQ